MKQKILIVGGVAGGASAAAKLRRNSEEDEIIMFEKGPHVSFSNCSLPYHLSGMINDAEDLVLMNPELFLRQYHIDARTGSQVTAIDRENKTVTVKKTDSGEEYKETYDKLILSPGAAPIVPKFPGLEKANVFTVRNVVDIDRLNRFVKQMPSKDIAVIGGGFIGIEIAENLQKAGFSITLVEAASQILRPFDDDMVQILHKTLIDHDINLILGDKVESFEEHKVILASGKEIEAGAVVMAIGVSPETQLAKEAGLEIGETGAIKVNKHYQTSDPSIYAVGDAVEIYHALTRTPSKLSLAGPALKQARTAADHIHGINTLNRGYIGSSAIQVFEYNGASTGLNEALIQALHLKINYNIVRIILSDRVGIMPEAAPMHFKLLFEVPTGKILGAQAIGKGNVTKRIDVIASIIKLGGTLEDLKDMELCYAPTFSTAKDIVNYAGYVGSNLLNQEFKQVNVDKVRELVENQELIIDVREPYEYESGHIKGAFNIPLSQLRERVSEIPKERTVYLHCRTGQRSYNAALALQHLGFQNVVNVAGSFLGLSFYEYYHDKVSGRSPIVTEYNFM
ncbi:FAD-dependent oxidoreductase [Lacrimispora sp.]|uniref:FAD-dependent oxidoreductase n=1 Tax=Lacrimispora sp. TaxID=2719234 RepID=UPI003460609A